MFGSVNSTFSVSWSPL